MLPKPDEIRTGCLNRSRTTQSYYASSTQLKVCQQSMRSKRALNQELRASLHWKCKGFIGAVTYRL